MSSRTSWESFSSLASILGFFRISSPFGFLRAFSYYIVTKGGRTFCPFTIWPDGIAIYKLHFTEKHGVKEETYSKFRENFLKIESLKNKYDLWKIPIMSTHVGEVTEYEIDLFIEAFKEFRNPIAKTS